MTKILRIDSSARTEGSVTRDLLDRIEGNIGTADLRRDLSTDPVPQIDAGWIGAAFTPAADRDADQNDALAISDALVADLVAADTILIGAPVYNFAVPAALKAWIDQVCRVNVTFKYTDTGPVGLLEGKRAIVAMASGGTVEGSDADYASDYMQHILGFIGITDVQIVFADAQQVQDGSLDAAKAEAAAIAA